MITKSTIIFDHVQADGRRYITESHQNEDGTVYRVEFLAPADWDAEGYLPTRAAQIDTEIAEREASHALAEEEEIARAKVDSWIKDQTPETLKQTFGLSDKEVEVLATDKK